jgi:hypothetical protein
VGLLIIGGVVMLYGVVLSEHFLKAIKGCKEAELIVRSRWYMYVNGKKLSLQQAGSDGAVRLTGRDLSKIKKFINKTGAGYIWFIEDFDKQTDNRILEVTTGRESLFINL